MLKGKTILILEDEPLIALDLETAVRDQDGIPIGPVATLAEANRVLLSEWPDGAILDLNVQGASATDLATHLRKRGVSVVIHSGDDKTSLPPDWPAVCIVAKPALPEAVVAALVSAMNHNAS